MTDSRTETSQMREDDVTYGRRRHHALDAFPDERIVTATAPRALERAGRCQRGLEGSVEPLITTRQLAELWCQTPRWVLRMVKERGLPHYELGGALRYRASEVEGWLQQHRAGLPIEPAAEPSTLAGSVVLRSVAGGRGAA
jgi:excisionase family DNA binding protein